MKKLKDLSTNPAEGLDKKKIQEATKELVKKIGEYQKVLYAQSEFSVLIILQGLDASGKDGVISKVFKGLNPLGCTVKAFKAPTEEERSYDFLWRVHKYVPGKGTIGIFNRSHYEDVLVPRVEEWINHKAVHKRFKYINNFEEMLQDNNTLILKFYLHISQEVQIERLTERQVNPEKFWKHNDGDWETSKKWNDYMQAYEDIFSNCKEIPWVIVPADKNWYKEYIIAKVMKEALSKLDLKYPEMKK